MLVNSQHTKQVAMYRYVRWEHAVDGVCKISDICMCGQLYKTFSENPVYGLAQSAGSSHTPNLSTFTVISCTHSFPILTINVSSPITIHEPPFVSFRHFNVLTQQQLNKHNTFYKHCTVSSHMYWDAYCNCEVVFVRSKEQPAAYVVHWNWVWKFLCILGSL